MAESTQTSKIITAGSIIRDARLNLQLSQRGLADLATVGEATVSNIESGKTSNPDHAILLKLAKALGLNSVMVLSAALASNPPKARYEIDVDTGCWQWLMQKHGDYGTTMRNREQRHTHSVLYEDAFGRAPIETQIHHQCVNPVCVNPFHLQAVTSAQHARLGGTSKITEDIAAAIILERAAGETPRRIALRYDLHPVHVSRIISGKHWAHADYYTESVMCRVMKAVYETAFNWSKKTAILAGDHGILAAHHARRLTHLNTQIWDSEELCRTGQAEKIVQGKLQVNVLNQDRNDQIELLDSVLLLSQLDGQNGIASTETLGSIIDRVSIMLLKVMTRMKKESTVISLNSDRDKLPSLVVCTSPIEALIGQVLFLSREACQLHDDIATGVRYCYRQQQLKSYTPPESAS